MTIFDRMPYIQELKAKTLLNDSDIATMPHKSHELLRLRSTTVSDKLPKVLQSQTGPADSPAQKHGRATAKGRAEEKAQARFYARICPPSSNKSQLSGMQSEASRNRMMRQNFTKQREIP